jgi:hypothetical protein
VVGRTADEPDGRGAPGRGPRGATDVVPLHLHTRRGGELSWQDRGRASLPRRVVEDGAGLIQYDGVAYELEDAFDDGRTVTVWARSPQGA